MKEMRVDEQVDYREEFENNFSAAAARVNTILDAAKSETPNANTRHSNHIGYESELRTGSASDYEFTFFRWKLGAVALILSEI
jgi:hypothetical protein